MIIKIEEIEKKVEVPDSFAELSEEEQNRYVQNIIIEYQRSGQPQIEESLKEEIVDEARDEGRTPVSGPRGRETRARDEAGVREARRECGGCRRCGSRA